MDYFLNRDGLCNRWPERIIELLHLFQWTAKMQPLLRLYRVSACDCASVGKELGFTHLLSIKRKPVSIEIQALLNKQVNIAI